jgi:predicted transcriptional regulator
MATKATTTKEQLHRLVDDLSESEADAALRVLADPLVRAIASAPVDDEPLTAEDEAAITEGKADIAAGRTVPLEEIERRYGIA